MICYPVIIPTLNRYEHFRRCIESLSRCTHAEKTEVVVGLDYPPSEKYVEGYDKIKNYLPEISGFSNVKVLHSEINLGPDQNLKRLRDYVENEGYDAYIATEDDNEFSPCFLDYMNKALSTYRNDENIIYICGYSSITNLSNNSNNIYFARHHSGWGAGSWFSKRKRVVPFLNIDSLKKVLSSWKLSMKLFSMRPNSLSAMITQVNNNILYGDSCFTSYCLLNNAYCLFPSKSLVRNWGNDGTGVNCKIDNGFYINQEIDNRLLFELDKVEVAETKETRRLLKKGYTKHWYGNIAMFIRYIVWRLLKKDLFVVLKKMGLVYDK